MRAVCHAHKEKTRRTANKLNQSSTLKRCSSETKDLISTEFHLCTFVVDGLLDDILCTRSSPSCVLVSAVHKENKLLCASVIVFRDSHSAGVSNLDMSKSLWNPGNTLTGCYNSVP